jgi:methylated-DNA-[protein]-cysteine S-methyltransferase
MPLYVNKSEFMSCIGKLYYLWREKGGSTVIVYLGNRRKDFIKFADNIKNNYGSPEEIRINSKKSAFVEGKISYYLEGKSKNIGLNVEFMAGTQFQKKIWEKLISVGYGRTVSYKELAEMAGYGGAWRLTGSALKSNPVLLAVPCHRVMRSDGSAGGFKGGKEIKKFLLCLEKDSKAIRRPIVPGK